MNAYKDMLDNVVSPITCVSMNHQNQLEQMANGAMFTTFGPLKKNLILVHFLSRLVKVGKKKLNLLLMFPSVIVYLMNCLNLEI
jgi:hypothetical protein